MTFGYGEFQRGESPGCRYVYRRMWTLQRLWDQVCLLYAVECAFAGVVQARPETLYYADGFPDRS